MSIQKELRGWDGKSAEDIRSIYHRHSVEPSFLRELLRFLKTPEFQKAGTWLLKHHFETGNSLNKKQVTTIFRALADLNHWESKLHLLQCLEYMPIEKHERHKVELFLRVCLTDTNNFVRAWAYNGFHVLSRQYPEYEKEMFSFFDMAMDDETAAVKARIRNIMKNFPARKNGS